MKSLLSISDIPKYREEELKQYFDPIIEPTTPATPRRSPKPLADADFPPADAEAIRQGCAWMQHCHDDAETLPEPEWYAMLSILGRCENGEELAHEWSRPYSGYSERETEKKLEHALTAAGPVTCQRVFELTGGTYCRDCEVWGIVSSPINIGTPSKEEESLSLAERIVKEAIETGEVGIIYKKEHIEAFRVLKEKSANEFARLKSELKDNLKRSFNIKDFEKAIKQAGKPKPELRIASGDEEATTLDPFLTDVPVKGLKKPDRYNLNMKGIWLITPEDTRQIFPVPVIISRRLKNVDTGEEKIELAYWRDGKWNRVITERSVAMNKSSIIKLSDTGLPVHSENAKSLVRYLGAFDAANLDMAYTRSVSHMGWVDAQFDRFLPGADEGIQLDIQGMAKGFKSRGTLEEWTDGIRPILDFPIARFMLAASFASPLLRVIGHRNFLVYPYGGTRGGKTAALKAALSIWGNPEEIMTTFNSTRNALERRAAFLADLPMGIDERQVVGDQQGFVESIAYMLGNGQSRGRATRDGRLQQEFTWHNITIATGEDPLSSESSSGGVKSRTIEIYGKPIDDEETASRMHGAAEEAFGVAGPEFIRKVIELLKEDRDTFKRDYKVTLNELKKACLDNIDSHLSAVAVVLLGDVYMNVWFFGKKEDQAVADSLELGKQILDQLDKKSDIDDAKRAYEAFMSWYAVYESYFTPESREIYGWLKSGVLYVYPTQFKKAMKELGFNDTRIRRDWAARGWILVESEGSKKRTTIRIWNESKSKLERVVAVKLKN